MIDIGKSVFNDDEVKKSLLFVYPNQFGYHTDTYKYCEYLQGIYNITYVCFDQGYDKLSIPGVKVIYCGYNVNKLYRLLSYFEVIISLSRENQFDIIFTVQFKYSFIIGLFGKSKLKILDIRTGDLSNNNIKRRIKNIFLRFDSMFFEKVTVISQGLSDILSLNIKKTTILPLGSDIISSADHSYDRLDLLYVGAIKIRNIHQTIEGLGLFLNNYNELRTKVSYTIVGFGPESDIKKLVGTIEKWSLQGVVKFLGRRKYTDLKEYFDKCNIGVSYIPVVPYYEHQPATKTFEYVLSGLYTIATGTIENRKVIAKSNGIICDDNPESFSLALEQVYINRLEINESNIRNSLIKFSWKEIITTHLIPVLN